MAIPKELSPEEIRALLIGLGGPGGRGAEPPPDTTLQAQTPVRPMTEAGMHKRLKNMLKRWQLELWLFSRLEEARWQNQSACLLCFEPDLEQGLAKPQLTQAMDELASAWHQMHGQDAKITLCSPTTGYLFLPEANAIQGIAAVKALCDISLGLCNEHGAPLHLTLNQGMAIFPQDADNTVEMMRLAEMAMIRARNRPGTRLCLYGLGRRSEPRSRISLGISIHLQGSHNRIGQAVTEEISQKGCSIACDSPPEPDTELELVLHSTRGSERIRLPGTCVWSETKQAQGQKGRAGVRFRAGSKGLDTVLNGLLTKQAKGAHNEGPETN